MREAVKAVVRGAATIAVAPALASYYLRSLVLGPNRALEGSTQAMAWLPGLLGHDLRRAFLACALAHCAPSAVVEFGTIFSDARTRIDDYVYIGPRCHIGLAHLERDVMLGPAVHVPSGRLTHGTEDAFVPMREQPGHRQLVRIGEGAWIGSGAVVMADVGRHTVIGAAAAVTRPVPDRVVAAGVPARVLKRRDGLATLDTPPPPAAAAAGGR
jgi:virginiamycin A acetyltransferase